MSHAGPSSGEKKKKSKQPKDRVRTSKIKKISETKAVDELEQAASTFVSSWRINFCLRAHG